MYYRSCFMMGHHNADSKITQQLENIIEMLITQHGVNRFIVGNHGSFDRIAANIIAKEKVLHPEITLSLLLAYHPGEQKSELPDMFNDSIYPDNMEVVPRRIAIVKANQYAVRNSDFFIVYAVYPASNSMKMLDYARKREKQGLIKIYSIE